MILIKTSIISTILVILVICLRMFLKNVLSKQSILILWYIVVLRSLFVFDFQCVPNVIPTPFHDAAVMIGEGVYSSYTGMIETAGNGTNKLGILWLCGFLIFCMFQVILYSIYTYRFSKSINIKNEHIKRWQAIYCKKPVAVKCSDYIHAPLTYGIIRPVILIPSTMNLNDTRKLRYIFLHEYAHIARRDVFFKILLLLTLAVHWYNPMIWLMCKIVNSDIEYACDESVVKIIGYDNKKGYATLLVDMAEDNLMRFNLCNHLSNCILEKRIVEIMKEKKWSGITKPLSCMIVTVLVLTAFISLEHRTAFAGGQTLLSSPGTEYTGNMDGSEIVINTDYSSVDRENNMQKVRRNSEGQTYNYEREMSEELGDSQKEIIDEIYLKTGVKVTPLYGNAYIKSEEDFLRE